MLPCHSSQPRHGRLPTHAVSLFAGWLLGPWVGVAVALIAVSLGAMVGYSVGRTVAGLAMARAMGRSSRGSAVYRALVSESVLRTALLVGLIRLSPIAPFAATNVALAGMGVGFGRYALGTVAGLAPRVGIVCGLGAGMGQLDFSRPASPALLILGLAAAVAALVLVTVIAQRTGDSHAKRFLGLGIEHPCIVVHTNRTTRREYCSLHMGRRSESPQCAPS